jgi:hypothetical protein
MSPAKTTTTALERLEALRAAVRAAQARVGELESRRSRTGGALERAKGPLREYYEAVGALEVEADPEREAELLAAVREVEASVSIRAVMDSGNVRLEAVDERLEGELRGAVRAVEAAESEVGRFIDSHREELAGELLARSLKARDRLLAAWEELQAASGSWGAARAQWSPMVERWGDLGALPQNPLAGATQDLEAAFAPMYSGVPRDPRRLIPMPRDLVPTDDPEEATDAP